MSVRGRTRGNCYSAKCARQAGGRGRSPGSASANFGCTGTTGMFFGGGMPAAANRAGVNIVLRELVEKAQNPTSGAAAQRFQKPNAQRILSHVLAVQHMIEVRRLGFELSGASARRGPRHHEACPPVCPALFSRSLEASPRFSHRGACDAKTVAEDSDRQERRSSTKQPSHPTSIALEACGLG